MLALVASIHALNIALLKEDVDGRDKPEHDGQVLPRIATASQIRRAEPEHPVEQAQGEGPRAQLLQRDRA